MTAIPDGGILDCATPSRREILRGMAVATGALLVPACAHQRRRRRPPRDARAAPGGNGCRVVCRCAARAFTRTTNRSSSTASTTGRRCPTRATATPPAGIRCAAISICLQGMGINMLRIMGASEGPDTEPLRIVPSLQPEAGQVRPGQRDRPAAPVRRAEEARPVRDPDHEQLLALVGRLLPVPGLGRQGAGAVPAAAPGRQLGHLPADRGEVLFQRQGHAALQRSAASTSCRSWRRTRW